MNFTNRVVKSKLIVLFIILSIFCQMGVTYAATEDETNRIYNKINEGLPDFITKVTEAGVGIDVDMSASDQEYVPLYGPGRVERYLRTFIENVIDDCRERQLTPYTVKDGIKDSINVNMLGSELSAPIIVAYSDVSEEYEDTKVIPLALQPFVVILQKELQDILGIPFVYIVTINTAVNGTVSATDSQGNNIKTGDNVIGGTVLTLTATPNRNYSFNYWTGNVSGSKNPTNITVEGNVTIGSKFIKDAVDDNPVEKPPVVVTPPVVNTDKFNDLQNYEWAKEAIYALSDINVINGMSSNTFAPSENVTREQFVKMLAIAIKLDTSNSLKQFSDVKSSDWFYPYVSKMSDMGYVNGISETAFGVAQDITRQDMAVLMYRIYVKFAGTPQLKESKSFNDVQDISDYAIDAVVNLRALGIVSGTPENNFYPNNSATRAEAAQMIYNCYKLIKDKI